jgi:hypothetical protein
MSHQTAARNAGVIATISRLNTRPLPMYAVAAAALMGLATAAHGVQIISSSQNEELQRRSSGTPEYAVSQAQPTTGFRVGYQTNFLPASARPGGIDALYFFKLPALPAGQTVSTATFSVSELKTTTGAVPTFNVDLYGVGYDRNDPPANDNPESGYGSGGVASAMIAPAFFYTGPNQTGATGAGGLPISRIADDLFTSADFNNATANGNTAKTTDGAISSPLAQYIQAIYDHASYVPGGYLLLRLTPDAANDSVTGTMRYQFPYAPTTGSMGTTYDPATYGTVTSPQIDVTFVPEPGSFAVAGVAAVGLLRRRRAKANR